MVTSFNLIDEPWIPVATSTGRKLTSLRDALVNAHHYLGLALDSPLEAVAIFRQVLLPVYLDALFYDKRCPFPRTPEQWAELWERRELNATPSWAPIDKRDSSDGPIDAYLKKYHDRFYVFGERPFAQVADLRTSNDETKPVSLLIASASSGNNVPLFSARTEANPPSLTPAEAIRAVLATHCWDTAGIKSGAVGDPMVKAGKTTGNMTGPVGAIGVVLPLGRTLAETLLLHVLRSSTQLDIDRPQWRADKPEQHPAHEATWQQRPPVGMLDLLTWQSRRIRLIPETNPDGSLVVRQVVVTAGDRLAAGIPQDHEPHTAWQMSSRTKTQVPVRHTAGQAAWRGMLPILSATPGGSRHGTSTLILQQVNALQDAGIMSEDYPLRVLTVGVQYGQQNAIVEDVIVDLMPLPVAALKMQGKVYDLLEQIVNQAEVLRQAANGLGDSLRQAVGGDKIPWDKGQRIGDQMMHEFSPIVRQIMSDLQHRPEDDAEAKEKWRNEARHVALKAAKPTLNAAPPQAFLGRVAREGQPFRASLAEFLYRSNINYVLGKPSHA